MIIYKLLFPIFLFVRSEFAENVYDPCSEFFGFDNTSLVKCQSEKSDDNYLECYDLSYREYYEEHQIISLTYFCWSRHDNNEATLKNLTISAGHYDNSELNKILNRPFTAKFYVNESHIICQDNEDWGSIIYDGSTFVYCPTSTGIPVAYFFYSRSGKL